MADKERNADKEREAKLAILNGLAGNYSATLAPETSKMWLYLLKNYSVAQVQEAALNVIRKHADVPYRSMPSFAMMQAELDALDGTLRGEENVRLQAEAEWSWLIGNVDSYHEPRMHPVTERVVRMMGGWQCICSWLEKDLNWRHKEFTDLWKTVQGKEEYLALGAAGIATLALPAPERQKSIDEVAFKRQRLLEHIVNEHDKAEGIERARMEVALKAYQDAFHKPYQPQENKSSEPSTPSVPAADPTANLTPEQIIERAKLIALRDLRKKRAFQQEAVQ